MTLKQLTYFRSVADSLSFTKASRECFISQTAISRQIQALEEELGVPLFVRNTVRVRLTPAGEYLFRQSKKILGLVEETAIQTRKIDFERNPHLSVGLPSLMERQAVMTPLRRFRAAHTAIQFSFQHGVPHTMINAVVEGQLDVLISMSLDLPDLSGLRVQTLLSSPCVLMTAADHPLAALSCVQPHQLAGETFAFAHAAGIAPTIERSADYYRQLHLSNVHTRYAESLTDVLMLVESGGAVAIVPSLVQDRLAGTLHFAQIEGSGLSADLLAIALPDSLNPDTDLFLTFLADYFSVEGG